MSPRRPRAFLLALAAAAVSAVLPAAASAGPLVASVDGCDNGAVAQRFLPWLDPANYFLVPGGDFEGAAAGWSLDGAAVAAGGQSFGPAGSALRIPAGASATSPTVCVGLEHPSSRFFVRRTGGSPLASLRVDMITETASGAKLALPVGVVIAGSDWAPSPVLLNVVNLLPLLPGDHAPMALRLTAQGGSFAVDDVHVDPYGRS